MMPHKKGFLPKVLPNQTAVIAVLIVVFVAGIALLVRGSSDGSGVPATATAVRTVPADTTSRVIEVDSVWVEVGIPPHHLFRIDVENIVLIRNLFGEVFEKASDGTILKDDVPVEGFGDPIPGLKLFFRAKGEPTRLVFSTWPKS